MSDTSGKPPQPGLVEFGDRLRRRRKERWLSQKAVAERLGCSVAAVSRYERGDVLLPGPLAENLDSFYRADGELLSEREALADGTWLPRGAFRTRWEHNHRAEHDGPIWMRLVPDPVFAGTAHRVEVAWGDWRICHEQPLEAAGAFFAHTKGNDGRSFPLEVTVNPACHAVFGEGQPPGRPVIDINHGWNFWALHDLLRLIRKLFPWLAALIERLLQALPVPSPRT